MLTREFRTGRTGNEVLAAALEGIRAEGIVASVYTHPIGFFGHAPGPTIGMWDNQGPTEGRGDWPLAPQTAYAIEGNIKATVPEWDGQRVRIMLEQDAWFDGSACSFMDGRQERLWTLG